MSVLGDLDAYLPDAERIEVIKKRLSEYNAERPGIYDTAIRNSFLYLGGYGIVAILIIWACYQVDSDRFFGAAIAVGLFGGVYVLDLARKPIKDHQIGLRYRLFPQIFAFIKDINYSHGRVPGFLQDLQRLKLITYTSSENDDQISGVHDGLAFEMVETTLIQGSGKHKTTVFKGIIFRFRLEKPFPGILVASKRGGWLERAWKEMWRTTAFDETSSGNARLDETHTFRTNNHQAAAPVIAGPLTSVLTWLGNEWHEGDVRIALSHDDCYLMLPSKQDYFRLPDIKHDVDYASDVKPIVREMAMLLGVAHLMRSLG